MRVYTKILMICIKDPKFTVNFLQELFSSCFQAKILLIECYRFPTILTFGSSRHISKGSLFSSTHAQSGLLEILHNHCDCIKFEWIHYSSPFMVLVVLLFNLFSMPFMSTSWLFSFSIRNLPLPLLSKIKPPMYAFSRNRVKVKIYQGYKISHEK